MNLSPQRLAGLLNGLPAARRYWVAYSGGLDSQVLLHALAGLRPELPAELHAIHIHHGLQPHATRWAEHCRATCAALQIPFSLHRLDLRPAKGESLEAVAREARYAVFQERMGPGELLLTAHHRDDQAETVLLQLLRGSGPSGLAAMPALAPFGPGWIARPLLDLARSELEGYARHHHLVWVEDDSNRDTRFDRNFLRQRVIPLLRERWPALDRTLGRSARHCAEAQGLIDGLAERALRPLLDPRGGLQLEGLLALPPAEGRAVLRHWIKGRGLPLPDTAHLDRILVEMAGAAPGRHPLVHWPGAEVRRYRGRLHLGPPLARLDPDWETAWDGRTPLRLPAGLGVLYAEIGSGGIPLQRWKAGCPRVRLRRPGDRCQGADGQGSDLTKRFQALGIPPWLRGRLPVIELNGQMAAVADLWLCRVLAGGEGEGVRLRWERGDDFNESRVKG